MQNTQVNGHDICEDLSVNGPIEFYVVFNPCECVSANYLTESEAKSVAETEHVCFD